jgi:hypothetical protein
MAESQEEDELRIVPHESRLLVQTYALKASFDHPLITAIPAQTVLHACAVVNEFKIVICTTIRAINTVHGHFIATP